MMAWAKDQKVDEEDFITLLGDPSGAFTKANGIEMTHPGPVGIGISGRCKRHAMFVDDCEVKFFAIAENELDPAGTYHQCTPVAGYSFLCLYDSMFRWLSIWLPHNPWFCKWRRWLSGEDSPWKCPRKHQGPIDRATHDIWDVDFPCAKVASYIPSHKLSFFVWMTLLLCNGIKEADKPKSATCVFVAWSFRKEISFGEEYERIMHCEVQHLLLNI